MFKKLEENKKGRDFVVGDIHGKFDELRKSLAIIEFNPNVDRLICLGDLIDRGERSHEALSWLQQPWVESVKGNHEIMLCMGYKSANEIDGCEQWMSNCWMSPAGAGQWALYLFDDLCADEFKEWHDTMEALPLMMEIDVDGRRVGFIHAEMPNDIGWDEAKSILLDGDDPDGKYNDLHETLSWGQPRYARYNMAVEYLDGMGAEHQLHIDSKIDDVYCIFQGHTTLKPRDGFPLRIGNNFYLDMSDSVLKGEAPCFKVINLKEFVKNLTL